MRSSYTVQESLSLQQDVARLTFGPGSNASVYVRAAHGRRQVRSAAGADLAINDRIRLHEDYMSTANLVLCLHCCRRRPAIGWGVPAGPHASVRMCAFCRKNETKYSAHNKNNPSAPPASVDRPRYCGASPVFDPSFAASFQLQLPRLFVQPALFDWAGLFRMATLTEELLMSRYRIFFITLRMGHEHVKFRGHTITLTQELEVWSLGLPRTLKSLPVLLVKQTAQRTTAHGRTVTEHSDFRVRTKIILALRYWLPRVHPEVYSGVLDDDSSDSVLRQLSQLGCDAPNGANIQAEMNTYHVEGAATASDVGPNQDTSFSSYTEHDMNSSGVVRHVNTADQDSVIATAIQAL